MDKLLREKGRIEEPMVQKFTKQLLVAVAFLHNNRIIHKDIKGHISSWSPLSLIIVVNLSLKLWLKQNSYCSTNSIHSAQQAQGQPCSLWVFFPYPETRERPWLVWSDHDWATTNKTMEGLLNKHSLSTICFPTLKQTNGRNMQPSFCCAMLNSSLQVSICNSTYHHLSSTSKQAECLEGIHWESNFVLLSFQ